MTQKRAHGANRAGNQHLGPPEPVRNRSGTDFGTDRGQVVPRAGLSPRRGEPPGNQPPRPTGNRWRALRASDPPDWPTARELAAWGDDGVADVLGEGGP